jgi:hypothetical protein
LTRLLPEVDVKYFAAEHYSLRETISVVQNTDVFISPHGATMTHMLWLRPGSAIVEVAYSGNKSMVFPGSYYWAPAENLDLRYWLFTATGEYNTDMEIDIAGFLPFIAHVVGCQIGSLIGSLCRQ